MFDMMQQATLGLIFGSTLVCAAIAGLISDDLVFYGAGFGLLLAVFLAVKERR